MNTKIAICFLQTLILLASGAKLQRRVVDLEPKFAPDFELGAARQDDCFDYDIEITDMDVNNPFETPATSAVVCQDICADIYDAAYFNWYSTSVSNSFVVALRITKN